MKKCARAGKRVVSRDSIENEPEKMLGTWHQATAPHLVVCAFVAMGLIPVLGPNDEIYMRVDREGATKVRLWTVDDRPPQDFASRSTKPSTLNQWFTIQTSTQKNRDGWELRSLSMSDYELLVPDGIFLFFFSSSNLHSLVLSNHISSIF
jgi:hypothetical protein